MTGLQEEEKVPTSAVAQSVVRRRLSATLKVLRRLVVDFHPELPQKVRFALKIDPPG